MWQGVLGEATAFLREWQRRMLLAGVQLRLLHSLPAPLNQLAGRLAAIASSEAVELSSISVTMTGVFKWSPLSWLVLLVLTTANSTGVCCAYTGKEGEPSMQPACQGGWPCSLPCSNAALEQEIMLPSKIHSLAFVACMQSTCTSSRLMRAEHGYAGPGRAGTCCSDKG